MPPPCACVASYGETFTFSISAWGLESRAYVLCRKMLGVIIRAVELLGHRCMVPLQEFLLRDVTAFTGAAVVTFGTTVVCYRYF